MGTDGALSDTEVLLAKVYVGETLPDMCQAWLHNHHYSRMFNSMKRFSSSIAKVTILSLVLGLVGSISPVHAAEITSAKDTMPRLKIDTLSNHEIMFVTSSGVASTQSIVITFPSDFDGTADGQGALDYSDVGLLYDASPDGTCANDGNAQDIVGSEVEDVEWIAEFGGTENRILTITSGGVYATVPADYEICVQIGENVYLGGGAANSQYTNASTEGSKSITIAAGADTGTISVSLLDDDQVTISATVDPSLTFDLDVAAADTCSTTESPSPYNVALETITTANSKVSGTTDGVDLLCLDLDTNATGGAVITVKNANGANGLVSTSVPADDIDSVSDTITNGFENYGICVIQAVGNAGGDFTEVAPFNEGDCTADEQSPFVGGFDGTSQTLANTQGNPIASGRVTVAVAAAISAVTDAHSDYTDTLTFIATGTF